MDRAERADALHRDGYNCAQSVACVLADAVGMDEQTMYKVAEGFGAGMGTGKGMCGALVGAGIIAGLKNSNGDLDHPGVTKPKSMRDAGAIQRKFGEDAGALICKELKTGNNGTAITSCSDCIRIAVRAAEAVLGL